MAPLSPNNSRLRDHSVVEFAPLVTDFAPPVAEFAPLVSEFAPLVAEFAPLVAEFARIWQRSHANSGVTNSGPNRSAADCGYFANGKNNLKHFSNDTCDDRFS